MQQWWSLVTATQPVPGAEQQALIGLVALGLVVLAWPWTRMLSTIVHEGGHATVARLVGRRLEGIRLHSDTSGLTVSRGRASGPGMVATLLAGYPAPALFGLLTAWVLSKGYAVGLLWGCLALLLVMLLQIRNLVGAGVMLVLLAGMGAATYYLEPVHQSWLAHLLTWVLLMSGPRVTMELGLRPGATSDPGQLRRLTGVPTAVWTGLFAFVSWATALAGFGVLVPQLATVWQGS